MDSLEAIAQNLRNAVKGLELTAQEARLIDYFCEMGEYTEVSRLACIIMKARLAGEQEAVNYG